MLNKPTNRIHPHNDNSPKNEILDYNLQCVVKLLNNHELLVNLALLKLQDPKF